MYHSSCAVFIYLQSLNSLIWMSILMDFSVMKGHVTSSFPEFRYSDSLKLNDWELY